jgi:hypothetical protein
MAKSAGMAAGQAREDRLRQRGRGDARRRANQVSEEDGQADTTIKVTWQDWQDMADGSSTA